MTTLLEVKRIGILFQDDMVRAILDGRKTLTSRLRGLEVLNIGYYKEQINKVECRDGVWCFWEVGHGSSAYPAFTARCPYGQAGDELVGRENFRIWDHSIDCVEIEYMAGGDSQHIVMEHRQKSEIRRLHARTQAGQKPIRPSIHMPHWASRLNLTVIRTWPSRLQDMTEEMALQEGVYGDEGQYKGFDQGTPLMCYEALWDHINGETHPWASNPWVWRVQFARNL